jgi:hypothetical protein
MDDKMKTHIDLKRMAAASLLTAAGAVASTGAGANRVAGGAFLAVKQAREIARGDPVRWYREDADHPARCVRCRRKSGRGSTKRRMPAARVRRRSAPPA